MDPPPLEGLHLAKRYGDVVAVDDVSLSVGKGEVVALIGPNGAGKSTLLSLLAGLLVPDAGTARIDGVTAHAEGGVARARLGFVAGDTRLYQRLTVEETLRFFGRLAGVSREALADRVDAVLDELEIRELRHRRCDGLSSGQEQRTNLARALVHDPSILILDEPTTALDVASQDFVLRAVERARAGGRAVLFASHIMGEVERVADRVVVLDRGRVRASGPLPELLAAAGPRGLGTYFASEAAT